MVDHMSKHLEVRQEYSSARRMFNFLLGCKYCQTWSSAFDVLRQQYYFHCRQVQKILCDHLTANLTTHLKFLASD